MCEWKANKYSTAGARCSSRWPHFQELVQRPRWRKSIFLRFLLSSLCVCVCVFTSRWWAWTLIKGLSPEEALQVRAKVASLEALKGQRADLGLQRAWEGNYLVSMWDCSEGVGGVQQYESLYVGTEKVNKERSSVRFSYVFCLLLSGAGGFTVVSGCFREQNLKMYFSKYGVEYFTQYSLL